MRRCLASRVKVCCGPCYRVIWSRESPAPSTRNLTLAVYVLTLAKRSSFWCWCFWFWCCRQCCVWDYNKLRKEKWRSECHKKWSELFLVERFIHSDFRAYSETMKSGKIRSNTYTLAYKYSDLKQESNDEEIPQSAAWSLRWSGDCCHVGICLLNYSVCGSISNRSGQYQNISCLRTTRVGIAYLYLYLYL